jgi:hypothetical protein
MEKKTGFALDIEEYRDEKREMRNEAILVVSGVVVMALILMIIL